MPADSRPHIGCPPTRLMPAPSAHSITLPFVLATSVTTLSTTCERKPLNRSRIAKIGIATRTTSARSITSRSVPATLAIPGLAGSGGVVVEAGDGELGTHLLDRQRE